MSLNKLLLLAIVMGIVGIILSLSAYYLFNNAHAVQATTRALESAAFIAAALVIGWRS